MEQPSIAHVAGRCPGTRVGLSFPGLPVVGLVTVASFEVDPHLRQLLHEPYRDFGDSLHVQHSLCGKYDDDYV